MLLNKNLLQRFGSFLMEKITDVITEGQNPCIPHCCIQASAHKHTKNLSSCRILKLLGQKKEKIGVTSHYIPLYLEFYLFAAAGQKRHEAPGTLVAHLLGCIPTGVNCFKKEFAKIQMQVISQFPFESPLELGGLLLSRCWKIPVLLPCLLLKC